MRQVEEDEDREPLVAPGLARPPSYRSDIVVARPATPSRTHQRRDNSPTPTYATYRPTRSPEHSPSRNEVRQGRPASRRLSDFDAPILLPQSPRPSSVSPSRLNGARNLPMPPPPISRSASPDTAIRMPLIEKSGWVDETSYELPTRFKSTKAYSVASYDTEDKESIDDDETTTFVDVDVENPHYGPAPSQPQPRRGGAKIKTTEVVKLKHGNLIIDTPIPDKLSKLIVRKDSAEFTNLRYSAITCDPDDFMREGYTLRQAELGRETELLICLTMYNEDERLFTRTLHGVFKNIAHLSGRTRSRTWGANSWKKILVCIVADGRRNVHPRVLDVLTAIGVYQDGMAQNKVDGQPVQAHLFEHTAQFSMTSELQFRGSEKGIPPVQVAFLLKENNQKKLNSHRWVFNGFGPVLQPSICVLLDVGTRPGNDSIYHLWKAMDIDSRVAGCAGKAWSALLNPLVASQNFEYKISNILDKPMESVFGFIQVLPGAFSAYRYIALGGDDMGRGPLEKYFKGEKVDMEADVFEKNMYLAEDRILCFELVAKRDCNWLLKYVKEAYGETDCPDTIHELVGQRRRWLNGATFAATFALYNWKRIWYTSHSTVRKVFFHIEFLYQAVQLLYTFFGLANFYLTFFFITQAFGAKYHAASYIFVAMRYLCIMVTSAQFILALGNRPRGAKTLFFTSLVIYSIIMMYTLFCATWLGATSIITAIEQGQSIFTERKFANLVLSAVATTGIYFVSSFLYFDIAHMFTSFGQYMILLPFYLCTLTIFAFCNIHDISWGTKEEDVTETDLGEAVKASSGQVKVELYAGMDVDGAYEDALTNLRIRKPIAEKKPDLTKAQEDYFKEIRSRVVLFWLVCNMVLMMSVSEYYGQSTGSNVYLSVIMYSVVLLTAIRFAGSFLYLVIGLVQKIGGRKSARGEIQSSAKTVKRRLAFWKKRLPNSDI